MKKIRRLLRQDNRGKVGKKIKGRFRAIQEELVQEKIKELKKKREVALKGNNYNPTPAPESVDGLPGHIPFGIEPDKLETLPQHVADEAFDSIEAAKEDNYGSFRGDLKFSLKGTTGLFREIIIDLQKSIEKISNNDPEWDKLSIPKKVSVLGNLSETLQRVNNVELSWSKPDSKKGGQTQTHLHFNVPDDPKELGKMLNELDAILGRPMMPTIPAPLPGQQQRILIETKPADKEEEPLQIGSGKAEK